MAKEKAMKLSGDRELGAVTKRLASGMFETSKGEKVPPFPGVVVGSKIKLVNSRFEIADGKEKEVTSAADADKAEMAELKKELEALKKLVGEKGSAVKGTGDEATGDGVDTKTTPPKVGA